MSAGAGGTPDRLLYMIFSKIVFWVVCAHTKNAARKGVFNRLHKCCQIIVLDLGQKSFEIFNFEYPPLGEINDLLGNDIPNEVCKSPDNLP